MIEAPTLLAYLAACTAIVVVPGPGQALVLSRTFSEGRRAGLLTALGLNVGTMGHAFAAAIGLSALLASSAAAFAIVKYAGAGYLVYLGVRLWRSRPEPAAHGERERVASGNVFANAMLVGVLNPKVALFFLAFLPPFVDPHGSPAFAQMLLLGAILAGIDVLYQFALVHAFDAARGSLSARPRVSDWRRRVAAAVLVALGAKLAA